KERALRGTDEAVDEVERDRRPRAIPADAEGPPPRGMAGEEARREIPAGEPAIEREGLSARPRSPANRGKRPLLRDVELAGTGDRRDRRRRIRGIDRRIDVEVARLDPHRSRPEVQFQSS